jgi:hypothetical protein
MALPMEELDPGENLGRDKKEYSVKEEVEEGSVESRDGSGSGRGGLGGGRGTLRQRFKNLSVDLFMRARKIATTFGKFIGPGFMVIS